MTTQLCTTCQNSPAKYKCPACASHTCSLECSKQHKAATKCSGKRNQTTFIPRSKFDDKSINNDYNFLTGLERNLDNAARLNSDVPVGRNFNQVKALVKRAKDVGEVTVQLAPRGMKRARINRSAWVPKRAQLSWTVEWLFDGEVSRISDRVLDTTLLKDAVAYWKSKVEDNLADFKDIPVEKLYCLIKNEEIGTREAIYSVLDMEKTLGEALRHRSVIEYPTIHVYTVVPPACRLERQYTYVQPSIESLATSLTSKETRTPVKSAGNDFIAFSMEDEDYARTPDHADSQPNTDASMRKIHGLPVIDFDDLEIPYS